MANLAIRGHATRGREVIELLEMLGGKNINRMSGDMDGYVYIINHSYKGEIDCFYAVSNVYKVFTLEEFLEKYPYKVGDKVQHKGATSCGSVFAVEKLLWEDNQVKYIVNRLWYNNDKVKVTSKDLQPYKETMGDKGNISDGYHTFNELYEYRLLYNASLFNELAKQGLYDVHKSKLHSDGTIPFDDNNWFIVQAELPTGQISNHYEMKDWDLFNIPVKEKANPYDGHTPQDVAKRLREFLVPKPQYPKTYEECLKILGYNIAHTIPMNHGHNGLLMMKLQRLLICRDAYWKIAGDWKPDWNHNTEKYVIYPFQYLYSIDKENYRNTILVFPTKEMRDAFYENFKDLIESCKELL